VAEDPRWRQLRTAFAAELEERVHALTELLLRLERAEGGDEARRGIFDALFREAHSLKGAARAVELRAVEEVAHRLESTLAEVRQGNALPAGAWFDGAYHAVDALMEAYHATLGTNGGSAQVTEMPPAPLNGKHEDAPPVAPPLTPAQQPSEAPPAPPARQPAANGPRPTPGKAPTVPARPPARRDRAAPQAATADSVRVAVGKLDVLLAQAGELAVTRGRVGQRLRELQEVGQDLEQWRREWRASRALRTGLRRRATAHRGTAGVPSGDPLWGSSSTSGATFGPTGEVDTLLRFVDGAEQHLQALLQRVGALVAHLHDDTLALGIVTRSIEDEVMAVRLLPLTTIFAPLERLARDLTRDTGKEAVLVLEGGEAEIDRKILDGLRDPLMHMLRNAVDHGIERPDERLARGKPRGGTITLSAAGRGSAIEIALSDDGAGLDPARLRAAAASKGLLVDGQGAGLSDAEALELIFRPGFSTRETVTETSGRGVGMDVVRENVQRLGGHLAVDSRPGEGTRFTLSVPLTLATTRVVLLEQGGQIFALPSLTIERTARVQTAHLVAVEGSRVVPIGGVPVPIIELADVLERPRTSAEEAAATAWRPYVVLSQGERRVALLVDRLIGEQEIVMKSLGWPLRSVRNVAGAAVLGSGRTVVILNASDLLRTGLRLIAGGRQEAMVASARAGAAAPRTPRLLVVEDSLTTRTLEVSILEAAGYDVLAAANGMEALHLLRSHAVDLVVSDIEMPLLDGFALTTEVRRDEKLRQIPIILVTSLEAPEHRERGVAAGADAYVLKSQFDQGLLLDTVSRLL
jgi:two-component system chemotaxis sensor kinase CheA